MRLLTLADALAAVHAPVVIAVVVHRPLAVEQQPVLAELESQRAVGALVELVAVLGVRVELESFAFGTGAELHELGLGLGSAACLFQLRDGRHYGRPCRETTTTNMAG